MKVLPLNKLGKKKFILSTLCSMYPVPTMLSHINSNMKEVYFCSEV